MLQPSINCPNMKALADYVHSKGLKLGIYSSPGLRTCAGYEGSYGHEELDARTWAEWGIDYLRKAGPAAQSRRVAADLGSPFGGREFGPRPLQSS